MNLQKILILFFSLLLMACPTPDLSPTTTSVPSDDDTDTEGDGDRRRGGGRSYRGGGSSSSSSSSSSSGGGSSSGGSPARCSGSGVSVRTHTINGECPDTDGSDLTSSRKLARIKTAYDLSRVVYQTLDETALNDAPSQDFRVAGVGDSDPDQDLILAMWVFGPNLYIYTLKDPITEVVGNNRLGVLFYLNGDLRFLTFLGESVNEYKGKRVLVWRNHLGGRYNRVLGADEVDIHWAYQTSVTGSFTCTFWDSSSATTVLSGTCPRSPDSENKLTEMSFTEYGRYLKSDYEISMERKDAGSSDPEQSILLHYYRAGSKQIAVLNKSAISYSSSDTYYLYIKPLVNSAEKTKYSLTALDGEYCGDNDIQHISFEVEDGPDISDVYQDIWLAKETDDSCIFYTKN